MSILCAARRPVQWDERPQPHRGAVGRASSGGRVAQKPCGECQYYRAATGEQLAIEPLGQSPDPPGPAREDDLPTALSQRFCAPAAGPYPTESWRITAGRGATDFLC